MTQHYFSPRQSPADGEMRMIPVSARGKDLQMWVSDGVFSGRRLDPGTQELLRSLPQLGEGRSVPGGAGSPPAARAKILDLGCGWGPIATLLSLENPGSEVLAVDVNPRALALAARNAEINGATGVEAALAEEALAECRTGGVRFDLIVSNPPVRIGKAALHQMLLDWLGLLAPDGEAWLVMNKNLGADSLLKWLGKHGFSAQKVASRKGFRTIRVTL